MNSTFIRNYIMRLMIDTGSNMKHRYMYIYHHHLVMLLAQIFLTLSLTIRLYRPLLLAGLSDYFLSPDRHAVFKFKFFVQHFLVRVWRTSLMGSSLLLQQCPLCLVLIWIFLRCEVGGRIAAFLWDVTSTICSI